MADSHAFRARLLKTIPLSVMRAGFRALTGLHHALQRATEAVMPADMALFELSTGVIRTGLLGAAAELRFADHLADGALSSAELAERSGANADAVHRTMRALVSYGVFSLGPDGRFRNNRLSNMLREGAVRDSALYWGSGSNMRAWSDFTRTVRSGAEAFERVHGMDVWKWFADHPDEARAFNAFMQSMTVQIAPFVAAGYPFEGIRRLCDVAGGRGTLLAGILDAWPDLDGVLVDSPRVLEEAKRYLEERGLASRVDFQPGSFFDHVPGGADAYILKDVLHDWDDARSITILKTVRRAMYDGAKVLVIETVMELNETRLPGPMVDVHMMTVCASGRQRSEDDFRRLLAETGYRLTRVVPLAGPYSVVEGIAV